MFLYVKTIFVSLPDFAFYSPLQNSWEEYELHKIDKFYYEKGGMNKGVGFSCLKGFRCFPKGKKKFNTV